MLFYFFIILLSIIAFISLIVIPKRQARNVPDIKERIELENKLRATFAQILGGVILLFGIFFAWEELKSTRKFSNETLRVSEQGQITERFTRAIEQLGGDKLAMRLGGIYALERIANDSLKDHWQVMEVLTAYVREMAPLKVEKKKSQINELTEQRVGQSVERSEIGRSFIVTLVRLVPPSGVRTSLGQRRARHQRPRRRLRPAPAGCIARRPIRPPIGAATVALAARSRWTAVPPLPPRRPRRLGQEHEWSGRIRDCGDGQSQRLTVAR